MRILIVSGIWPPDIGGPASHAPDVAQFLTERGHEVRVVVTAERKPAEESYPVDWIPRSLPKGISHGVATVRIARATRQVDVVYATGMFARAALAAKAARRPLVLKLTGDPAFERVRARRRVGGDVESFQHGGGGLESVALRAVRNASVRSAAHVFCPSDFLRDLAISWGVSRERVSVLPNAIPAQPPLRDRRALRASFGIREPTLAFAGRFAPQKSLEILVGAVDRVGGVSLLMAGDGEPPPVSGNVRLLGPLARERVLELFAAADGAALSSSWENFPHMLVEALSVGTPVIATRVGGVAEIVEDGSNGLLVPPNDVEAFADAIGRFFADDELRARLAAAAAPSVARYRPERIYAELEATLATVVR